MFGDGNTKRDYTYVSDIIDGILLALKYDESLFEIINSGSSVPIRLNYLIKVLEDNLNKKAIISYNEIQLGDVPLTYADINKDRKLLGYSPKVDIKVGIKEFINWFNFVEVG